MKRLIAKKNYGAWYMPPDEFEKTLLQGYMNKLEGLVKPGEEKVDFGKPQNVKMVAKQVHALNQEAFEENV